MGSGAFLVEACRFLGDKLVEAWSHYKELPAIPPDEDPSLYARRLVAQRCLYGVDVNPFATDLSKLSLWLATLAKDHPFTFLDHALRFGDSLVGFSRLQIGQFHWDVSRPHERVLGQEQLEKTIDRVTAYRKEILEMAEDNVASILLKQQKLGLADQALETVRRAGDLLVASFFNASKDKERDKLRGNYRDLFLSASRGNLADLQEETKVVDDLRGGKLPVTPFHWEIEFPEVFWRENPGFDAFVGNPPFMGGNGLSQTALTASYLDLLAGLTRRWRSATRLRRSLLQAGILRASRRRNLWPDRNEYDCPRGYTDEQASLDMHARGDHLRSDANGLNGRVEQL